MLRAEGDEVADWGVVVPLDVGAEELAACCVWRLEGRGTGESVGREGREDWKVQDWNR